jgi:hypothetical protein
MINLTSSADARNSEVALTFTVVSTAAHDRAWWAEEASRASTDWPSVVAAALELLVASGILEPEPDTDTMTPWDAPSWREAAVEYHRDRAGRLAAGSSRSSWRGCAGSCRTASRWSAPTTTSTAASRRRLSRSMPSSSPCGSVVWGR